MDQLKTNIWRGLRGAAGYGIAWVLLTPLAGRDFAAYFGLSIPGMIGREVAMTIVAGVLTGLLLPVARHWIGAFVVGAIVAVVLETIIWWTSPTQLAAYSIGDVLFLQGPVFAVTGGFCGLIVRRRFVRKRRREIRVGANRGQEDEL